MCLSQLESIAESRNASATSITAGRSSDGRRWTWSVSEWSVKFFKTYFQCNLNSVSYNSYFPPSNSGTSWMSYLNKNAMWGRPWPTEQDYWPWCSTRPSSMTLWPLTSAATKSDSRANNLCSKIILYLYTFHIVYLSLFGWCHSY